jgi:hypothetical protein
MRYAEELSYEDRQRLRKIVMKEHFKHYPNDLRFSDKEADKFIESLLPETIYKLIKRSVDNGIA